MGRLGAVSGAFLGSLCGIYGALTGRLLAVYGPFVCHLRGICEGCREIARSLRGVYGVFTGCL